jgi:hypothetical protein
MNYTRKVPTIDGAYNTTNSRERALSYAQFLRDQLRRTDIGSEQARYLQCEQLRLLQRRHDLYEGVRLTPDEVGVPEKYRDMKIPTCDAIADCRGSEPYKAKEARDYGLALERKWVRARLSAEKASIAKEVDLLAHGLHPKFPGVEVEELLMKELTCDAAYTRRTPTRVKTFDDDDDVNLIMNAIQGLHARCDKLDKLPMFRAATEGPGMTPRALNPNEAYRAAMTAYQMEQAKANQRRAHESMPNVVPAHPDDIQDDLDEQRQVTSDARHARHSMIARTRNLTFATGKQKQVDTQLTRDIEAEAARGMREREAALMSDMVQTIQEKFGE